MEGESLRGMCVSRAGNTPLSPVNGGRPPSVGQAGPYPQLERRISSSIILPQEFAGEPSSDSSQMARMERLRGMASRCCQWMHLRARSVRGDITSRGRHYIMRDRGRVKGDESDANDGAGPDRRWQRSVAGTGFRGPRQGEGHRPFRSSMATSRRCSTSRSTSPRSRSPP